MERLIDVRSCLLCSFQTNTEPNYNQTTISAVLLTHLLFHPLSLIVSAQDSLIVIITIII